MTQIIEYTKHSDSYLIYHFEFECNDDSAIGKYAGNCSLNKFMSLSDWHQILNVLHEPVDYYLHNPFRKPTSTERQIDSTHLQITWSDMDATFYSKLLHSIHDFDAVFPFVIHIKVFKRSNVDKFVPADDNNINEIVATPIKKPKKSLIESKKTPKENIDQSTQARKKQIHDNTTNGIKIKDCCVRLPLLKFDENGEVIQNNMVRNKRKFSELNETAKIRSVENTPDGLSHQKNKFMVASTSTPFPGINVNLDVNDELKRIESDVRETFDKSKHKTVKRLSNFPRVRLLKAPEEKKRLDTTKKAPRKNTGKTNKIKRLKPKAVSISNESDLFESSIESKKHKNSPENEKNKKTLKKCDLKELTDAELCASFDDHHNLITDLFHAYLKQTDAKVRRCNDYKHFDMISLFTTQQFSVMLDILFDKFVKVGEFGEICYDALFLELIVPEWSLAIYMKRHALDREAAIAQICARKTNENQSYDGYTSIVSIKLDESMNTSSKH